MTCKTDKKFRTGKFPEQIVLTENIGQALQAGHAVQTEQGGHVRQNKQDMQDRQDRQDMQSCKSCWSCLSCLSVHVLLVLHVLYVLPVISFLYVPVLPFLLGARSETLFCRISF